ncbi:hypothetical protein [Olsenella sp. HMSC062G07]|uniref:hypothetical protein n=1 Tax=Olsenella sp. HMSC062G07 TaxID=1739330 RepID=UPI0008A381A6|nr:hypothetical protein [Olsenella sp. HMSC062G07]OFK24995.1 hypothetical protein HMPREF2826_03440 [Olsenella sp. HMSC062G07]
MNVTDNWNVAGLTVLTLSEPLPDGAWKSVAVDGEKFEALRPMYAGDISQVKNNPIGIRGEHGFTGKTIEFL